MLRGGKNLRKSPLPDRQSWIQKNVAKMQAKAASKAEAKAAKMQNHLHHNFYGPLCGGNTSTTG